MKTKLERINKLVMDVNNKPSEWRWGQAYFNYALQLFPIKAEECRGDDSIDPFHNDNNINKFVEFVCS
jgi:hypothetical protein